jgi:MGT family glycosyltransferase
MALAHELQARGHQCVVATSSIYREKVEAAGLEFRSVRPDLPPPHSDLAAEMIRKLSNSLRGPEYLFRGILMPHLRDTYADTLSAAEDADIIVSHQVPLTARLVAEKTGIKHISCVLFPIAFASVYDPPTPPQFPALRALAAAHPLLAGAMLGAGKWMTQFWVKPIHELREELGLPTMTTNPVFEGQHSPTLVLALFSKYFGPPQPDFPPNTLITGFPFYDRDDQDQGPEPEKVLEFLDDGEPPIVFTLGSALVWSTTDFYRVSIEAARQLGERALLLVGDTRNLPDGDLPPGIAAFDYAPHNLVMPRARVVVHQGGIGTTGQALRSGRPMLVVPHGQDQPDNARRCAGLGVGLFVSAKRYTPSRVVRLLRHLIDDPAYSERASEVGRLVREEDGTNTACDAIEKVLAPCG